MKDVIISKSTDELNQENLILARNSVDKNFVYNNSIKNTEKISLLKVQVELTVDYIKALVHQS